MFSMGSGRGGKLGDNIHDRYMPLKVGSLSEKKVDALACSELHSAVVTCKYTLICYIPSWRWHDVWATLYGCCYNVVLTSCASWVVGEWRNKLLLMLLERDRIISFLKRREFLNLLRSNSILHYNWIFSNDPVWFNSLSARAFFGRF